MTALTNFPELLSLAIIYSIAAGAVCYMLLRLVLWLGQRSGSLLKYHLSNACLAIMFVAFLWPFKDLQLNKSNSVNIGEQINKVAVAENKAAATSSQGDNAKRAKTPSANIGTSENETQAIYKQDQSLLALATLKINESSNIILAIYLAGLLFFSCRLLASYIYSRSLKISGISSATEQWLGSLQFAMSKLNMTRDIRIFFSSRAIAPCIIGHSKAVILIPIALSTQLSTEQAEAILLHELSHLKHYDYYINIAMQVINCLLFFNPFVWLTIKKCKQYREQACDEITTREERSLALAESLAFIAENTSKLSALTLMLKENKYKLLARIQNLLGGNKREGRNYGSLGVLLIPLLLSVCMVLYSTNIFSQKKDDLKTRLEKVSQEMFDEGNVRYMIVDALADGILQAADTSGDKWLNIEINVESSELSINRNQENVNLPVDIKEKYVAKMQKFMDRYDEPHHKIYIYNNDDTLMLRNILNPQSQFRSGAAESRIDADITIAARKKMIRHFLNDKLINPDDHLVYVTYHHDVLTINYKSLQPGLKEKYMNWFSENGYKDVNYKNGTKGIWEMPYGAAEYVGKKIEKNIEKEAFLDKATVAKLKIVSDEMFKNGNEKYIVVDALTDGFIPISQKGDIQMLGKAGSQEISLHISTQQNSHLAIYGKEITDLVKDKYVTKMKEFVSQLKDTLTQVDINIPSSEPVSLQEIFDPNSPFRKTDLFERYFTGFQRPFMKTIVQNLLHDKLMLPNERSYYLECGSVGKMAFIKINGMPLSGPIKEKYKHILENQGIALYDNHVNMAGIKPELLPCTASEFVADMPALMGDDAIPTFDDPIKPLRDQLVSVSREMYDKGNEKYAIVDAIVDSFISLKAENDGSYILPDKHYSVLYMGGGNLFINSTRLEGGMRNDYDVKMYFFRQKLHEPPMDITSVKFERQLTIKEILDPNSSFRKLNLVDRREAGFYTMPRKKMVKHFLEDKLITPNDDKLTIAYNENSVSINDKELSGKLKAKYLKLLVQEYGADLNHSYSGVWNMPGTAKEYIHSKKENGGVGLNSNKQTEDKLAALPDLEKWRMDNIYDPVGGYESE